MSLPESLDTLRLHTCEECLNNYLLAPDKDVHSCQRDDKPLTCHNKKITDIWLPNYTGFCANCGRLTKLPHNLHSLCSLCDCPTRIDLPHKPKLC